MCFVSLSIAGETLASDFLLELTLELLEEGHYVNITTNGTLTGQFDRLLMRSEIYHNRLLFTFSLHYLELKRMNLLNHFWSNVEKVRKSGCSICIKVNLCDSYVPYIEQINEESLFHAGAYPQYEITRYEENSNIRYKVFSKYSLDNYRNLIPKGFSSLFEFTCDNFTKKRNTEFCYAGDWAFTLNLATGEMRGCYCDVRSQNIFEDTKRAIRFMAIGNGCKAGCCHNGQHFLAWGVIPSLECASYGAMRNRINAEWFSESMLSFTNTKLIESNKEYSNYKKKYANNLYKLMRWRKRR